MNQNHYDLIVVGAGVLGTFHAYHAARMGKKILLTEKDQYPVNATVRNFGQVVPSGMAGKWLEYGERSTEIYKAIQKECDISVRQNGSVYIASDDEEQCLIHELKQIMDNKSYEAHILSSSDCLQRWPSLKKEYCKEAIFFPQEVSIEPDKMIHSLIQYLSKKFSSLDYKPATAVLNCSIANDLVTIQTSSNEKFSSEKLIICNGGEYKLLFADLFSESGIVLSKLQMMKTVPMQEVKLEGNILTGLSIRRYESFEECPSFNKLTTPPHYGELKKWGIHILFKKATDGSIIIGDSHEYADVNHSENLGFNINQHINELMLQEASRIVDFDVRKISQTWAGFYPQHPEKEIVEYDIEDKIHIRTAIGGKGMTSSAGYAEESIRQLFS